MIKYCILPDEDAHKYLVPVDKREEWDRYVQITSTGWDQYDEVLYNETPMPDGVIEIDNLTMIEFYLAEDVDG